MAKRNSNRHRDSSDDDYMQGTVTIDRRSRSERNESDSDESEGKSSDDDDSDDDNKGWFWAIGGLLVSALTLGFVGC